MKKVIAIGFGTLVAILIVSFSVFMWSILLEGEKPEAVERTERLTVTRSFSEAPDLQAQVKAGELPPVEERLPKAPLIVVPNETIGKYGGIWHWTAKSRDDHGSFWRTIGYDHLARWNTSWTDVIPNIAQSWEVSPDAREYVFRLREGMRWSDGAPFTADDILFWYEDIFLNKELTPSYQDWLTVGGEPVVVTKIDDTTVKFAFSEPYALFLQNMAQPKGDVPTRFPKHVLERYHIGHNPDLDPETWAEEFIEQFGHTGTAADASSSWAHPDIPTLNAWMIEVPYGTGEPVAVAVRNPYYWKIDTAGNQLPYIDSVEFFVTDDDKEIVQRAIEGKIDMQDRNVGNSNLTVKANRDLLEANQDAGGYRLFQTVFATMNTMMISFNMNHLDPVMRGVFQDKDVRIGLSHAVDRQRIIDEVFGGRGRPYQGAPRPESPFYDEEMALQYTEYSVEKADAALDAAGLTERDAQGYRLLPDGRRFSFTLDGGDQDSHGILLENWEAVGVEMKTGIINDRTSMYERKDRLEHDAVIWTGDGGLDVIIEPRYYFPYWFESNFALAWAKWFATPADPLAEEPPEIVRRQQALYDELKATPDRKRQEDIMRDILAIAKEQFYAVGISLPVDGFGIVKKNMRNVPDVMPAATTWPTPAPTNPPQYFYE